MMTWGEMILPSTKSDERHFHACLRVLYKAFKMPQILIMVFEIKQWAEHKKTGKV
jgi:hypothetical protein